jgi:hypothetical protein
MENSRRSKLEDKIEEENRAHSQNFIPNIQKNSMLLLCHSPSNTHIIESRDRSKKEGPKCMYANVDLVANQHQRQSQRQRPR